MDKTGIYSELPDNYVNTTNRQAVEYIQRFLRETVPSRDLPKNPSEYDSFFKLRKEKGARKGAPRRRKPNVSRAEKQQLGLLKCPREGWSYEALSELRALWQSYVQDYLCLGGGAPPSPSHKEWDAFSQLLARMDLHGAQLAVSHARCPSHVGVSGTCVQDTRNTLVLVGADGRSRAIPKRDAVFRMAAGRVQLTFFGRHLRTRPGERSTKKLKGGMRPAL